MGATLQTIDATTLRAVLKELRPVILPSRFEKAQQSDAHTLQLALRRLEGSEWLELSWLAEAPRLLAVPAPPKRGEGSTLARQLQHGLRGLALVEIAQAGWERVVELRFAPRPGEAVERSLVLELMGRHSNLFLLDGGGEVIAAAHQVRSNQSRWRPIGTGDPYRPPPPLSGEVPRLAEEESSWRRRLTLVPLPLKRALMETYQGVSPALARQLAAADPCLLDRQVGDLNTSQWQTLWCQWRRWLEVVEGGHFQLSRNGPTDYDCWGALPSPPDAPMARDDPGRQLSHEPLPINQALAAYHGAWLSSRRLERRREALRQKLITLSERERGQEHEQLQLLAAAGGSQALQRQADDLFSAPHPDRERIQEAQKLYRRARKLRRSVAAIEPLLERHRQRLDWFATSLMFLDQSHHEGELEMLEQELADLSGQRNRPKATVRRGGKVLRPAVGGEAPGPQPLELCAPSGLRLQVGRNHRQNEWISLRQARRGDLWFHAQETPGSHVVLKASEGAPDEGDLIAAADLAAHFSRARGNGRVPVVMVPADELQRIPGAGAGTVRHRGGTILWGEPERARALLGVPMVPRGDRP